VSAQAPKCAISRMPERRREALREAGARLFDAHQALEREPDSPYRKRKHREAAAEYLRLSPHR
jgi:hypothetical protein